MGMRTELLNALQGEREACRDAMEHRKMAGQAMAEARRCRRLARLWRLVAIVALIGWAWQAWR